MTFTSGGTEANNLALFGLAGAEFSPGHLVSTPLEHPAVAEPIAKLEAGGFAVSRASVDDHGLADVASMAEAFRADTRLRHLDAGQ